MELSPLLIVSLFAVLAIGAIAALWLYRKKIHPPEEYYKRTHLPEPSYLTVEDFQIAYIKMGQGPCLLFIHGIGASFFCWRYQIERLSQDYTVIAIDLPGFGHSSKIIGKDYGLDAQTERIIRFLNKLNVEQCRIVGSSMGGSIALNMARLHPERFFEIACIAPATDPRRIPRGLSRLGWISYIAQWGINESTIARIMGLVNSNKTLVNQDTVTAYFKPYKKNYRAIQTFLASIEAIGDSRLPHLFTEVKSSVLLLWGARDQMVLESSIRTLHRLLPQSQFYFHNEGGHHLQEDEPQWVNQSLIQFFGNQDI